MILVFVEWTTDLLPDARLASLIRIFMYCFTGTDRKNCFKQKDWEIYKEFMDSNLNDPIKTVFECTSI